MHLFLKKILVLTQLKVNGGLFPERISVVVFRDLKKKHMIQSTRKCYSKP